MEREDFTPVPVKAGDRLLLVISMTEKNGDPTGRLDGKASAGITIL